MSMKSPSKAVPPPPSFSTQKSAAVSMPLSKPEKVLGEFKKKKANKKDADDAKDDSHVRKAADHARLIGGKEWRRSKLMLVGEGRAGKTALLNALMGLDFVETDSTVGIDTRACEVKITGLQSSDGGNWKSYNIQNVKQAELALAELAATLLNPTPATEGKSLDNVENEERLDYPRQLNQDLVVSLVKAGKATADSIIFSAWDYGGQEVFYALHHLFLSRYGVYLICFNMEWLIDTAPPHQVQQCLYYLNFWLNSIAVHTQDDQRHFAPTLLIGTHKDVVSLPEQHEAISHRLAAALANNHVFWSSVRKHDRGTVKSGRGQLWFFPVNNKIGRKDVVVRDIMDTIQKTVSQEEYLKHKVPFSWFKVYDSLQESSASYLSHKDLVRLASECGLPSQRSPFSSVERDLTDETQSMLKFFNQLGIVMYHHDEALRDTVVLDAAAYLVAPATEIIRDHSMHQPHEQARKSSKWLKLMQDSVLDPSLLPLFWNNVDPSHHEILVRLLVKFGLFVPLLSDKVASVNDSYRDSLYLVPSLLKPASAADAEHLQLVPKDATERPRGFLIHFAVESENTAQAVVDRAKLTSGFLPNGLFGRVLGKCVAWTQSTSSFQPRVFADKALLCWGDVLFTIEADNANHCIVVNIHPAKINPRLVMQRLRKLVQEVIRESMPHLQFCVLLEASEFRGPGYMVNLDRLGEAGGKVAQSLLAPEAQSQFRVWLPHQGTPDSYDVFVSSLLKGDDAAFSGKLFHCLSLCDNGIRPIEAFWDREYLLNGERRAVDPGHALCCSLVVVPLLTPAALQLIASGHKEGTELLFEWVLAMELSLLNKISVLGLAVDPSSSPSSPFDLKALLATLPDTPPCVNGRVMDALKLQGFVASAELPSRTTRGLVAALLNSCIRAEEFLATQKERFERLPSLFVTNLVSQCVQPAVQKKLKLEAAERLTRQHSAKVLQHADLEWLEKVGAGIAGDVWRCRWHSTEVAVKVLKDQSLDKKQEFDKEVEVNTRLPFHERIVPMNGVVLEPKCIVLKYLPRLSIDDYVIQGQRLTAPADFATTLGIAVDASAGITHLHEEGVIHRDISCRNFLLDDHLRAYVCDFGLSQFLPKNKAFGIGDVGELIPLRWMAPEAILHRHYNQATDTYMFGMFLYEFIARMVPFRAEFPGASNVVLAKAIQAGSRPLLPISWPKELQDMIRSCWAEDPKERPSMSRLNARLTSLWESVKTSRLALAPGHPANSLMSEVHSAYDGYVKDYYTPSSASQSSGSGEGIAAVSRNESKANASNGLGVFSCSVETLGQWLSEQGLPDLVPAFVQHQVDGSLLSRLSSGELSLLGLTTTQCERLLSKLPMPAQDVSLLQHIIELKMLVGQQNTMLKQLLSRREDGSPT